MMAGCELLCRNRIRAAHSSGQQLTASSITVHLVQGTHCQRIHVYSD